MAKLSLIDYGFLLTESHHSPKHVGCLQTFKLPPRKGSAWLRKLLAELKTEKPGYPFNQWVSFKNPLQPEWVREPDVDMDYHVRHTVLPYPGDDEQLWKMLSRLHSNLLDRERPLWEFHLIEGLSDRRFAFYLKIHHAMADGVTIARWFSESGSDSPEDMTTPAIWHGEKKRRRRKGKEPSYADLVAEGIKVFGGGVRTAMDMATLTVRLVQRRFLEGNRDITLPLSAPKTRFNVVPGAARRLAATEFLLEDIHTIAHNQDVSINDVLLTICDLAVNRYFADKDEPLDEPLVVYMPVNLRTRKESEVGNMVSLLQVRMSHTQDDPLDALHQVSQSSVTAREVFSGFGRPAIQLYSLAVALLSLFEESLKLDKVLRPVNNLVISNVPGPPRLLYFRGAENLRAFPISTLPPMTALNVTANSYAGIMHIGMVAGRTAIPDLDLLVHHVDEVFAEMKELAG